MIVFAYKPPAVGAEMSDHRHALEDRAKALTGEALQLVAGSGVQASAAVVDARPAEGLLAWPRSSGPRMIVIGTHGERPLMGSSSARLLTSSCTARRGRSSCSATRRRTPDAVACR